MTCIFYPCSRSEQESSEYIARHCSIDGDLCEERDKFLGKIKNAMTLDKLSEQLNLTEESAELN